MISQKSNLTFEVLVNLDIKLFIWPKSWLKKVVLLPLKASELKFDLRGHIRSSYGQTKMLFDNRTLHKRNFLDICDSFWAIDVWNIQIGLRGQIWPRRSKMISAKVVYLIKTLCWKEIVLIHIIVSELWMFKIVNFTSEVKFDLRGQSSFR